MRIVQLDNDLRIVQLFDAAIHVDEGVEGVEISDQDFHAVWEHGVLGDWKFHDGAFVLDPLPVEIPIPATGAIVSGEIPRSIL